MSVGFQEEYLDEVFHSEENQFEQQVEINS